ncbi:MAG: hypothetical protein U0271_06140 [Polyangiaceae bacterium]
MKRLPLMTDWRVRALGDAPPVVAGRSFIDVLPSSIHLLLLGAGVLSDPYIDANEEAARWVEDLDWEYACSFSVPRALLAEERVDLVLEDLDTLAELTLNGVPIGSAANMFHPHRFAVRALLEDANTLSIRFRSAARHARAEAARLGPLPFLNTRDPFNFVRKPAYHFGWDWAPTLVGCGLGAARLEAWSGARIAYVRPLVASADRARARLSVFVDLDGDGAADVSLGRKGHIVARGRASMGSPAELEITSPELWWPREYGAQPLYDVAVETADDRVTARTGVRAIALDTNGGAFTLRVNEQPVYCRGACFVPEHCFHPLATDAARVRRRLEQAAQTNMNMLRVWGGGFYETEAFYDACDELGLMVWQDFMFACAAYPEEAPYPALVEAEARHQLARLARHPSLVLWNGCNENLWGYYDWGWAERTRGRTWGRGYYFDLLPRVAAALDPSRPYWPASPYSGVFDPPDGPHPNSSEAGNRHLWDAWDGAAHPAVGREAPRFVSEVGLQGPPAWATMERAMTSEPQLEQHQKSENGERAATSLTRALFGEGFAKEREHHLRQVAQARGVEALIRYLRSRSPVNAGVLIWQLNDAWPGMSWSAIDHDERKKPLYYALRRAFAPAVLAFEPAETGAALQANPLAAFLINDTDVTVSGALTTRRLDFDGAVLAESSCACDAPPRSVVRVELVTGALLPKNPRRELLEARLGALSALHFFLPDKELALPAPALRADVDFDGVQTRLYLTAETLCRDLVIHADRLDSTAEVSDQLVTLLPGESAELTIARARRPLSVEALCSYPVLQTAAPAPVIAVPGARRRC